MDKLKIQVKLIGILILGIICTQCVKEPKQNIVKCEINGLENGDLVVFSLSASNHTQERIDSTLYDGTTSTFEFITLGKDVGATVCIIPAGEALDVKNKNYKYFFLEGYSTLKLEAEAKKMKYARISGGIYDLPEMQKIGQLTAETQKKYSEAIDLIATIENKDSDKTFHKSILKQVDQILEEAENLKTTKIDVIKRDFIKKNPDIAYSAALLYYDTYFKEKGSAAEFERVFMQLSDRVRKTRIGKTAYEYLLATKLTALGQKAPDFTVKDIEGSRIKFSDFNDKYVLLCFWKTWEDCFLFALHKRDKEFNEKVAHNKLVVYNVILNKQGRYEFPETPERKGWIYTLDEKASTARLYGIQSCPYFLWIDSSGKIREKGKLSADVISEVNKALN